MNDFNQSPVMITREEYEELVKLRMLAENAFELYSPDKDGDIPTYTCVETKLLLMLAKKPKEIGDGV